MVDPLELLLGVALRHQLQVVQTAAEQRQTFRRVGHAFTGGGHGLLDEPVVVAVVLFQILHKLLEADALQNSTVEVVVTVRKK